MSWPGAPAEGTPETTWRAWGRRFPALDLTACTRAVVVAPHPDDEVLGVGGLLARLAAAGVPVEVVAVTDGDASHPGSPTLGPTALAAARRTESVAALRALGVPARTTRLGLPDGAVAAHEDAVAEAVTAVLGPAAGAGTWVLATWRGDGHPDHEATGRAAHRAATAAGARLLEFPVWTWHWSHPEDPRVPWDRLRAVALSAAGLAAKQAAVACFRTQVAALSPHPADAPVLPAAVLARLLRTWEAVLVAGSDGGGHG